MYHNLLISDFLDLLSLVFFFSQTLPNAGSIIEQFHMLFSMVRTVSLYCHLQVVAVNKII